MTPEEFLLTGPDSRAALVAGLGPLLAAELPLDRLWIGGLMVHPLMAAVAARWTPDGGVEEFVAPASRRGTMAPPVIAEEGRVHSVRLAERAPGAMNLPVALWDEGYAEVAFALVMHAGRALGYLTFATKAGFSGSDLARLDALLPLLRLVLSHLDRSQLVEVLAATYLGPQTARRVIDGEIHRGDGERILAAIWFSDLRGFSALSERLPTEELLGLLDDAFEAQVACVERHGGEVLKFIGDGLLAVFRHPDEEASCAAALEAAISLRRSIDATNARREAAGLALVRYGLSLHFGQVTYGNIGAPGRLDFTVVGSAVNLAARLEGLCAQLGRDLLVSEAFAARCQGRFEPLGRFTVKGVGELVALGVG